MDCRPALQRATTLGWIDFGDTPSDDAIDMVENYDKAAKCQLHVVVTGRLLAFPDGARRFSLCRSRFLRSRLLLTQPES